MVWQFIGGWQVGQPPDLPVYQSSKLPIFRLRSGQLFQASNLTLADGSMARNPRLSSRYLILVPLLLLGFGLRLYNLEGHSLWYDELLELDIAQGSLADIGPQLPRHAAMPLDYYLLHGWVTLGRQEGWVRLPAVFWGWLAIALIYALGQRLFKARIGLLAALLLTFAPFAVRYSREVRPYALLLCLTLIAFLGLWQVYRTGRLRDWLLVGLGLSGAVLSHYFALFLLAPMGLWVAVHWLRHLNRLVFWRHTACFALIALGLTLLVVAHGRLLVLYSVSYQYGQALIQPSQLTGPATEKPNRGSGPPLTLGFIIENGLAPFSSASWMGQGIYVGLFCLAILSLVRDKMECGMNSALQQQRFKERRAVFMLLGWLFLPAALIYLFLMHRGTFFASRYVLYVLPAFLVLVAAGLNSLISCLLSFITLLSRLGHASTTAGRPVPLLACLVYGAPVLLLLLVQTPPLLAYYSAEPYEDWRAAGELLHRHARPEDAVIAVQAEPAINWYYPQAAATLGTFLDNETLRQTIVQHPRRWFVLSSYSHRRDQPLRDWLAKQGAVRLVIDRRIVIYYHQQGLTTAQLLAQVKHFELPPKSLTYLFLGDQFSRQGDYSSGREFYQRAVALAPTAAQRASYQTRLAALPATDE